MAATFEKAVLLTREDEPLRDLAHQWARTPIHEDLKFNDLRNRLLALEAGEREVDAAQMGEVLMHALSLIGQSLWANPRGTLALLDEYRGRSPDASRTET